MAENIRSEYARLCERFETRFDLYDQMTKRHKRERELIYADLVEAGAARDTFAKAHPEVLDPPAGHGRSEG